VYLKANVLSRFYEELSYSGVYPAEQRMLKFSQQRKIGRDIGEVILPTGPRMQTLERSSCCADQEDLSRSDRNLYRLVTTTTADRLEHPGLKLEADRSRPFTLPYRL